MRRPGPRPDRGGDPPGSLAGLLVLLGLFAGGLLAGSLPQLALRGLVTAGAVVAVVALLHPERPRFGPPGVR